MGPQAGGHEKERGKTTVDKGEKDKKSKKKNGKKEEILRKGESEEESKMGKQNWE